MSFGIDVSQWNGFVDWPRAKAAGVAVGICKATEGLNWADPTFARNWAGMAAAGIARRSCYHFGHPANDPIAEADHYLGVVQLGPNDLAMLDNEVTDGLGYSHNADWARAWCDHVAAHGHTVLYYSYSSFIRSMGSSANQLTMYPLYEAQYSSNPPDPAPWARWSIWQNTDHGSVPGVFGNVDSDQIAPGAFSLVVPAVIRPQTGGHMGLNKAVRGLALSPSGKGYIEVAEDGGVFAFGDAPFHGALPPLVPNAPVVGIAYTPDGGGYWQVAEDGGVFCFGNAQFFGSMGGHVLNAPIMGMVSAPDGKGYVLVASDGGVFPFGDVPFVGSAAGK